MGTPLALQPTPTHRMLGQLAHSFTTSNMCLAGWLAVTPSLFANTTTHKPSSPPPPRPARLPRLPQLWEQIAALPPEQQRRVRAEAYDQLLRRRKVKVDGKVSARQPGQMLGAVTLSLHVPGVEQQQIGMVGLGPPGVLNSATAAWALAQQQTCTPMSPRTTQPTAPHPP